MGRARLVGLKDSVSVRQDLRLSGIHRGSPVGRVGCSQGTALSRRERGAISAVSPTSTSGELTRGVLLPVEVATASGFSLFIRRYR